MNFYLTKKEAEVLFKGDDDKEYEKIMSEPEHMSWSEIFLTLQSLKLAKYCYMKKEAGGAELRVVNMDDIDLNIAESGNALLYLLPIIFRIFNRFWKEGKTNYMFIEHPELYLHSALHKLLPGILHNYGSKLMIEIHSEALIKELQARFSKGELDKKEISLFYFSKHKFGTIENFKIEVKSCCIFYILCSKK